MACPNPDSHRDLATRAHLQPSLGVVREPQKVDLSTQRYRVGRDRALNSSRSQAFLARTFPKLQMGLLVFLSLEHAGRWCRICCFDVNMKNDAFGGFEGLGLWTFSIVLG